MAFTVLQKARLGLSNLLSTEEWGKAYYPERSEYEVIFPEHPFGLEHRFDPKEEPTQDNCRLIAGPMDGIGVHRMLLLLQDQLRNYHPRAGMKKFRLRVIHAQIAEDWHKPGHHVHWLYFELINNFGSFICGGCTDCSGHGSAEAERLETVFSLIALLYDKKVEEVVIPMAQAEPAIKKMENFYHATVQEREVKAA